MSKICGDFCSNLFVILSNSWRVSEKISDFLIKSPEIFLIILDDLFISLQVSRCSLFYAYCALACYPVKKEEGHQKRLENVLHTPPSKRYYNMNISYKWLKEYVDFDMTAEEVAVALTSIGLEVELWRKYKQSVADSKV